MECLHVLCFCQPIAYHLLLVAERTYIDIYAECVRVAVCRWARRYTWAAFRKFLRKFGEALGILRLSSFIFLPLSLFRWHRSHAEIAFVISITASEKQTLFSSNVRACVSLVAVVGSFRCSLLHKRIYYRLLFLPNVDCVNWMSFCSSNVQSIPIRRFSPALSLRLFFLVHFVSKFSDRIPVHIFFSRLSSVQPPGLPLLSAVASKKCTMNRVCVFVRWTDFHRNEMDSNRFIGKRMRWCEWDNKCGFQMKWINEWNEKIQNPQGKRLKTQFLFGIAIDMMRRNSVTTDNIIYLPVDVWRMYVEREQERERKNQKFMER